MDDYTFRVPVPDHLPHMHFDNLIDAKAYAARAFGLRVWNASATTARGA